MLQLLDLAKENAALKSELRRIREEAEALQHLLSGADISAQSTGASETPRRPGETEEVAGRDGRLRSRA